MKRSWNLRNTIFRKINIIISIALILYCVIIYYLSLLFYILLCGGDVMCERICTEKQFFLIKRILEFH